MKKLLAAIAVAMVVTGSSVAFANGYQDVKGMDKAQGASLPVPTNDGHVTATYATSSSSEGTDNKVTVASLAAPKQQAATAKTAKLPSKAPSAVVAPPVVAPSAPTPPANCFVASEEGIYVPLGANTGTITLTADRPVYWQAMSQSIAATDAGSNIADSFPAYIVLESTYDPAAPTTAISFHLHARADAPLGEYCPATDVGQIGLIAYTTREHAAKLFDVPMNINVVEYL